MRSSRRASSWSTAPEPSSGVTRTWQAWRGATGVQYEFALADARPFPPELVMPLFLAVTSARELDSGLPERSGTMRIYDPETRLSWEIEVEGLGRVSVRRGPTT
jgi:hypothetical protein